MSAEQKVMNRWLVVAGAIAIQIALGAIYAWSAFTKPLQSDAFGYSKTETQAIFSAGLASFGIVMIIAGRLQQRYPARNIALIGGGLLGLGYILGGFNDSFIFKLVTIGIIGGAGIGFAYVVPIAVGVKWFPDKKGLLTGLAVAGFGFGAFIWILMASPTTMIADTIGFDGVINTPESVEDDTFSLQISDYNAYEFEIEKSEFIDVSYRVDNGTVNFLLLDDGNYKKFIVDEVLQSEKNITTTNGSASFAYKASQDGSYWLIFRNTNSSEVNLTGVDLSGRYYTDNINQVFLIYGVLFAILVTIGAMVMVPPPEGWLPEGWTPPKPTSGSSGSAAYEFESQEMLRTPQFYMLWSMFVVGALAGLMVIGNIKNFAQDPEEGFTSNAADIATIGAAICLPIFNGLGRIAWGSLSDRIGRQQAFIYMFSAQALMMFIFFWSTFNEYAFYLVVALIGFNFGGNFALFPAATADNFGSRNIGANYGIVFTSYAAGGIIGPILAGMVKDGGYSYTYAFIPAAVLCVVAVVLAFMFKAPDTPKAKADEA